MISIEVQRDSQTYEVTPRDGYSSKLNEVLAMVDMLQAGSEVRISVITHTNGTILAWVEDLAGPAPEGTAAIAITRGQLINEARDNYEGVGRSRALKAGRKALLAEYGN